MRGFIYNIVNLINGKKYVGSTEVSVNHRYRKHISDFHKKYLNDSENRTCRELCDAFYEFGLECFIVEELEMIYYKSLKELRIREGYYQQKLDTVENGYNMCYAGRTKKKSDAVYFQKMKGNQKFQDKRHKNYLNAKEKEGFKERQKKAMDKYTNNNRDKINARRRLRRLEKKKNC